MKSKLIFALIICLIGSTVISCIFEKCGSIPNYFEIKNIKSAHETYDEFDFPKYTPTANGATVSWSVLVTSFHFEADYISYQPKNFGSELMARKCNSPGSLGSKMGGRYHRFPNDFDYNENYNAGSVVNDIVAIDTEYPLTASLEGYLFENSERIREDFFI